MVQKTPSYHVWSFTYYLRSLMQHTHRWDLAGYNLISGVKFLSESNKNGIEVHFECDFLLSLVQTWPLSHSYTPGGLLPTQHMQLHFFYLMLRTGWNETKCDIRDCWRNRSAGSNHQSKSTQKNIFETANCSYDVMLDWKCSHHFNVFEMNKTFRQILSLSWYMYHPSPLVLLRANLALS